MEIRKGTPVDAPALAEIAERTFRETFAADNRPEDIELHVSKAYGHAQQGAELSDPSVTTLLVHNNDVLVGYAQLRRGKAPSCVVGDATIELHRFYIDRDWHGRGLAPELMQSVTAEAVASGARILWLGVWEHNERAKAFYRRNGFVDVGYHVFVVGTDPQVDRIMTRALST